MSQEWEPGDLAMVGSPIHPAEVMLRVRTRHGDYWQGGEVAVYEGLITTVEPLVAVPAGFGERLAEQIEELDGLDDTTAAGRFWQGRTEGLRLAAEAVRREFTQPVSPETNGEQK